ncbi:Eco57I restriction-modification methylase domain-containing protein [Leptolyngbya sp. AN03gr2]|uniref:Eco57I restriction-modification methylase domain-containing protein n=1 Tax=unclassified Leptolyngbya TaxID=2650499 RepID=UPI003D31EFF2
MNIAISTISRQTVDLDGWWASLKHGGLLIAPSKLSEFFQVHGILDLPFYVVDRLRRDVTRMQAGDEAQIGSLLDTVLEQVLGLEPEFWHKGASLNGKWTQRSLTGETLKPRRVWLEPNGGELPVFVDAVQKLGIGRGKRSVARVIEWLRKSKKSVALLTNGHQWRLIHAGTDYDAWCEWEIALWFEEGELSSQVLALRSLLGRQSIAQPTIEQNAPLVAAIQASRQSQAELSEFLGERVRQAIELLIRESSDAISELPKTGTQAVTNRHIYIAATRMIMRCVVILFAEARDLLPRNNPIYHNSYGIQGLREQLDRASGGRAMDRLRNGFSAWSRLLALFRLVYQGSAHEALPVPKYGGGLFAPGAIDAKDPVLRSLSAFEQSTHTVSDATVYRILELLCRSRVKVRQGRSTTWVEAPVDFSDLSSEYIGILYEGLLDFELRQAIDNPIVFLNLGDQPALPLERLENMSDSAMASLVEKLKQKASDSDDGTSEESEEEIEEETEEETIQETEIESDDRIQQVRDRALQWAIRAVVAGKLVAKPRSKKADATIQYEKSVNAAAQALLARIILPGEWFLVRWGGTRKGLGTFYTPKSISRPTVRRTLEPLCEDEHKNIIKPQQILELRVCDPAMGSGSFLISALRYITEKLYESLHFHGCLESHSDHTLCRLADGVGTNLMSDITLPVPLDHPDFEERLKAHLKLHIVSACIYGVDIDALAVELAKISLWIETMDRTLSLTFLDHKLKCGNALVGCWVDQFADYPVMAWERDGGDAGYNNFVHHFREYIAAKGKQKGQRLQSGDKWTQAIKDFKAEILKPELKTFLEGLKPDQQLPIPFVGVTAPKTAHRLYSKALKERKELQQLTFLPEEQQRRYDRNIQEDPEQVRLKLAFDTWCAIWFWSGELVNLAPTPLSFFDPSPDSISIIEKLAEEYKFFHWEIEFNEVFANGGFDAVVGNPPWEIQNPKSQEFFSNIDPLYRTYGKQEALKVQQELFEQYPEIERDWLSYCARFKALSNWSRFAASPFGCFDSGKGSSKFTISRSTKENQYLHELWQQDRQGRIGETRENRNTDNDYPYQYQGSADINTYKMFLEVGHMILRESGRIGIITPSGIYSDKGTAILRSKLIFNCKWIWLYGFENQKGIFKIHRSFKFCSLIVQKGRETEAILVAFMQRSPESWENEAEIQALPYPKERIEKFSPKSKAFLEICSDDDLMILEKMYANSILLGDDSAEGWGIRYATEFHMTGDSKLFPPRSTWEARGYQPDEYGHWLKGEWKAYEGDRSILQRPHNLVISKDGNHCVDVSAVDDVALPLYQGVMIQQFDFAPKRWISGTGVRAVWEEISWDSKIIEPQFLMSFKIAYDSEKFIHGIKPTIRRIARNSDTRTAISSLVMNMPCGDKASVFSPERFISALVLPSYVNSYVFDWLTRIRVAGTQLDYHIAAEMPIPKGVCSRVLEFLALKVLQLNGVSPLFSDSWLKLRTEASNISPQFNQAWKRLWAVTSYERLRLRCILDAVVTHLYGLTKDELRWILRDCDLPASTVTDKNESRKLNLKGFWRVDKDKSPELRHTVLTQIAFHDLQTMGLEAFLSLNNGEGWMLPETLRLSDYGLGTDDRARMPQPVAEVLGDRFLPWQLEGTIEDSWAECEKHAALLKRLLGTPESAIASTHTAIPPTAPNFQQPTDLFGNPLQTDLFGNIVEEPKKRKRK